MLSGKFRWVIGSIAVEFLLNYFRICPSTEVLKVTRCMCPKYLICVLAFLPPLLWYVKAKCEYNFKIKNFVFRNNHLLEKIGLLFFFSIIRGNIPKRWFSCVYVYVCVHVLYIYIHTYFKIDTYFFFTKFITSFG